MFHENSGDSIVYSTGRTHEIYFTDTAFAALQNDGSMVMWDDSRYGGNSSGVTLTDATMWL